MSDYKFKKYRKKPVTIEAVQWNGDNAEEVLGFSMTGENPIWGHDYRINSEEKTVLILTLEGEMTARVGDWIIRGISGEFYPCKPDIFEKTYEEAPDAE